MSGAEPAKGKMFNGLGVRRTKCNQRSVTTPPFDAAMPARSVRTCVLVVLERAWTARSSANDASARWAGNPHLTFLQRRERSAPSAPLERWAALWRLSWRGW